MNGCTEAMAAYARALRDFTELGAEAKAHLASCDRCAALLVSAKEMEEALTAETPASVAPDVVGSTAAAAEQAVSGPRRVRLFLNLLGITLIGLTFALVYSRAGAGGMMVLVMIISIVALAIGTIYLLFGVARNAIRDKHGRRIHKRLGPGRQLSGVCLGLSEATGINVAVFRLAFIVLTLADGIGIVLYIFLDLLMPLHPDDRQHLWRFRIARAWRARFGER